MGSLNFYKLLGGRRFWGFMFSFLLLWACGSDDPVVVRKKEADASKFGFTLLKITDVKEISVERLKKQLKSESGWTIKSIKIDDESFAEVTGSLPNLKIILKKSGTFTASITLQKKGWQDFVLKDCKIQVVLPKFSFSKFTQSKSKKTITSVEILKQIAGAEAAGYAIKSIVVSDENFAKVSGTAPKLQIDIQKVGKFTATIVLSHKSFFEITLQNCAFEIVPEFIFDKLTVSSSGSKTITAADLLKQITGAAAAGYTIKSIAITEDTKKLATANGTAITLDLTKTGVFKATIILKKDQHSDITLKDCEFEISGKKAAPTLTFTKLSRKFSTAPITKAEILKQIKQDITGWTLKNVVLSNASFGDVDSNFSIRLKKIGSFSAKLTFERAGYLAAEVTGTFEITKGSAATLKFTELKRSFKGDKIITAVQLLAQIANVKTWGYALKSIGKISDTDIATASGTQITIKKVGSFTAELILESANYEDAKVQASFEVSGKNVAPVLSFATLKRNYSGNKIITKAQILNQITATSGQADWGGFTLKSIVLTENASLARVNNATFELTILKAGTFKARLTFTKDTYVDAVVLGTFEIAKVTAPILGFTPISKKFGGSNTISKAEILGKITGDKTGYVLKSIVPSDNSFASVSAAFEMTLRRAGNFTATITLYRENYEDAVIKNCSFKIAPGDAPTDLRLTAFTRNFADSRTITAADIFAKISGKKDGYVLKSISINSGNDVATVSDTKPVLQIDVQKAGNFTANIVLERANYEDATVPNVIFTIEKIAAPTGLSFTKLKKAFGQTITAADILANVTGTGKGGYTLRSILIRVADSGKAEVRNLTIVSKKVSSFTATLTLKKANYNDVSLSADFEIVKAAAPKLTFTKFTRNFAGSRTITTADIWAKIDGNKTDYSLKSISKISGPSVAALSGLKEITIKTAGDFTAEITLEKANYEDAKVTGTFSIEKIAAPTGLIFTKLTRSFGGDKTITAADIWAKINSKKTGYSLKSISQISDTNVAALSGLKEITIKTAGDFTAEVTLSRANYEDAKVTGVFSIAKARAKILSFSKVTKPFGEPITAADILKNVKVKSTLKDSGYTLKALSGISDASVAALSGLTIVSREAGTFTAEVVLEHTSYKDVTIAAYPFEITKVTAPSLGFDALSKPFGETITAADILANVKGSGKTGYVLKSIAITSGGDVAALSGLKEIVSKKVGDFKATLVLEKTNYEDVTIRDAAFTIAKAKAPSLTFNKLTRRFTETIAAGDILPNVRGVGKTGYILKALSGISDGSVAALSGLKEIVSKKVGTFRATIILEKANYEDAFVRGDFEIIEALAPVGLRFAQLKKPFAQTITAGDIEKQVQGIGKEGYTLKSIGLNGAGVAALSGLEEIISLKTGVFSADLVLEKANYEEVSLLNSSFEFIAPVLDFEPLEKYNNDKNNALISTAEIMAQVRGKGKTGYTLKEIRNISDDALAELSGLKTIKAKTEATFTADIVLERAGFYDAAITGCKFSYVNVFIVSKRYKRSSYEIIRYKKFEYRSKFKILNIPGTIEGKQITYIALGAFYGLVGLESVTVPNSMEGIGGSAFSSCPSLTSVDISPAQNRFFMSVSAFSKCKKLKSVNLGDKITMLGADAFLNCTALTAITIPLSVTTIQAQAFKGCTSLVVTMQNTRPNSINLDHLNNQQFRGVKQIRVPASALDRYKNDFFWNIYDTILVGY